MGKTKEEEQPETLPNPSLGTPLNFSENVSPPASFRGLLWLTSFSKKERWFSPRNVHFAASLLLGPLFFPILTAFQIKEEVGLKMITVFLSAGFLATIFVSILLSFLLPFHNFKAFLNFSFWALFPDESSLTLPPGSRRAISFTFWFLVIFQGHIFFNNLSIHILFLSASIGGEIKTYLYFINVPIFLYGIELAVVATLVLTFLETKVISYLVEKNYQTLFSAGKERPFQESVDRFLENHAKIAKIIDRYMLKKRWQVLLLEIMGILSSCFSLLGAVFLSLNSSAPGAYSYISFFAFLTLGSLIFTLFPLYSFNQIRATHEKNLQKLKVTKAVNLKSIQGFLEVITYLEKVPLQPVFFGWPVNLTTLLGVTVPFVFSSSFTIYRLVQSLF